ncbi:hypothetical protein FT663_03814 [Candidozyma haemuli var. vulneris]|uniref:Endoribonuclease YSH1 n=1 Tax=Candidozyma haemuli TaxID=45357 RepID=A0A2V1ANL6_9ASCO|nr:hypothetical protein CXQ85_003225 [[Candida] haemuloni]KAF3985719.1 hypothetical protein FT662_04983 [[Candida] haemuloni var. vulneris]KAF3988988.1 hypothetical protein FT663_03814 [[Candida] haemuloni var. vulneris]PVH19385.1 hypothetical protein CXQ85_003225 [[Candida] haemuloni]
MAIDNPSEDPADNFKFFGLGGCNEVGRSSHILEYKNKVIMLDSGVHPGLSGMNSLPFFDEYDLSKVDILLISHFHLDHAASLPYVMQQTNFKGRVFMTHATKAIYRWLLSDFVRVTSMNGGGDEGRSENNLTNASGSANLYTDEDLMVSFDRIETIDYHSTIEVDGIRFTAYHAGHVLGACMYFVEVGGLKVLFTGDYSREEDRHLKVAEVPPTRPDVLITESTFGTATHEPRLEKEARLMKLIHSTILKGGRILMPVFALGRAQELLLILEEYWSQNKDIQNVNIYYASNLARKCMVVYQTYTSIMNDSIKVNAAGSAKSNPFDFKFIKSIKSVDRVHDIGPCVVVASPGMLQSGVSRQLLERWAPEPKNAVIMTGYSVEGTMAKDLLREPPSIPSSNNPEMTIPRRLTVDEISFAAHVDFIENSGFIDEVSPKKIILVHGDSNPMGRLKSALLSKYSSRKGTDDEVKVFNPRNCEEVTIGFKGAKMAKVVGSLAEAQMELIKKALHEQETKAKIEEVDDNGVKKEDDMAVEKSDDATKKEDEDDTEKGTKIIDTGIRISGVLISKDFDMNIMSLEDLPEYSQLNTSVVKSNAKLKVHANVSLIEWHLEQMFGHISVAKDDNETWECAIMDMVYITVNKVESAGALNVTVEWINDDLMGDSLADSIVAILLSIDSSPVSVKMTSQHCSHSHVKQEDDEDMVKQEAPKRAHANSDIASRIKRISSLLKSQFGDSIKKNDGKEIVIVIGKNEAKVDLNKLEVECGSRVLKDRVENIVKRGATLAAPLSYPEKMVSV